MKTKFILSLFLFYKVLFAQEATDKIFYSDSLHQNATADNYYIKTIVKDYSLDKPEYKYIEYYKSGSLKSEKTLSGKDGGFPIGEEINYYENGNKKSTSFYENKKQSGKFSTWYENGQLKEEGKYNPDKFDTKEHYLVETIWDEKGAKMVENGNGQYVSNTKTLQEKGEYKNGMKDGIWTIISTGKTCNSYVDEYKDGEFIYGYSIDKNGIKKEYTAIERRPMPKKGLKDFYQYIGSHFNYTKESMKNKISGRLLLSFVIDKDGKIIDPKIIKGLGFGLDEEAIRVVTSYENWNPGEQRGITVRCLYNLPLTLNAQ